MAPIWPLACTPLWRLSRHLSTKCRKVDTAAEPSREPGTKRRRRDDPGLEPERIRSPDGGGGSSRDGYLFSVQLLGIRLAPIGAGESDYPFSAQYLGIRMAPLWGLPQAEAAYEPFFGNVTTRPPPLWFGSFRAGRAFSSMTGAGAADSLKKP